MDDRFKTVPWITQWTAEDRVQIGPCSSVDGALALMQPSQPFEGKPRFLFQHRVRQRLAIRFRLCTVCGEPTEDADCWIWLDDASQDQWITLTSAESCFHLDCWRFAKTHCPHLRQRHGRIGRLPTGTECFAEMAPPEVLRALGVNETTRAASVLWFVITEEPEEFA